jgi:hypothetical protein
VHSFDEHSRYKRRSTYNGGGDRIPTPREILEAFDDSGFSRSTRSSKKHHQVTISWKSTISKQVKFIFAIRQLVGGMNVL